MVDLKSTVWNRKLIGNCARKQFIDSRYGVFYSAFNEEIEKYQQNHEGNCSHDQPKGE